MEAHSSYGTKTEEFTVTASNKGSKDVIDAYKSDDHFPVDLQDLKSTTPAKVKVSGGLTKNLGNFESLRVDVCIEMPCVPSPENIEKTYIYCNSWVSNRVSEIVEEALNI